MIPRRACLCLLALALCSRGACAEAPAVKAPVPAAATLAIPPVPTVIESGSAEMVSTDKETTFTFRNGVTVTGTNLKLTCDHLEVIARRSGDPSATFGKQEEEESADVVDLMEALKRSVDRKNASKKPAKKSAAKKKTAAKKKAG